MSEPSANGRRSGHSFVLQPETFSIPTLVLRDLDVDALDTFIAQQLQGPRVPFDQTPLVIDLSLLPERGELTDLPQIVGMLRGHGMVPVGVSGASEAQREQARALELALVSAVSHAPRKGLLSRLLGG